MTTTTPRPASARLEANRQRYAAEAAVRKARLLAVIESAPARGTTATPDFVGPTLGLPHVDYVREEIALEDEGLIHWDEAGWCWRTGPAPIEVTAAALCQAALFTPAASDYLGGAR